MLRWWARRADRPRPGAIFRAPSPGAFFATRNQFFAIRKIWTKRLDFDDPDKNSFVNLYLTFTRSQCCDSELLRGAP
jgi:hypothetical protein